MAVKLQPSFLRVAPAPEHSSDKMSLVPFLALTLFLPTIIVIGNCILGALTPITDGAVDDMSMLDTVWRLVQGQHLGVDSMTREDLVSTKWQPCCGVSLDRTIMSFGYRQLYLRSLSYRAPAS